MSKHTPGPYSMSEYGQIIVGDPRLRQTLVIQGVGLSMGNRDGEEAEANRDLLFDALVVCSETGLTPRQLMEQRAELLEVLESAAKLLDDSAMNLAWSSHRGARKSASAYADAADKAYVAIAKARGEQS